MFPVIMAFTLPVALPASDPAAERIGLKVHADAASLQKLPRFDYQARVRWGYVDSMRAEDKAELPELIRGLGGEISQKPREGLTWYESGFAWDETRFITGTRPGDTNLGINTYFGTRSDGWSRSEAKDHSRRSFTRRAGVGLYWRTNRGEGGIRVDSSYLRLTPQKWWWGESHRRTGQALTHQPLDGASWAMLPAEPFAGELCDVVEVSGRYGRFQRLWVGKASARTRGVLTFYSGPDDYNALVRFDDYREVASGVWVPFAEAHVFAWGSEKVKGKRQIVRHELRVTTARIGVDLAARYGDLLPKPGDPVQDQRFAVAVDTKYDPDRPDSEIRAEADAAYAEQLKNAEMVKKLTEPVARLVGKPAVPLPTDGWVGGRRPDVDGKPYLVHFWATSCGPCKNDLPRLKELAAGGVIVVGLHPSGTPAEEVSKAVADHELGYPTLVSSDRNRDTVAGYPVQLFPYCVFVDARGTVTAHGPLTQVLREVGKAARTPTKP